MGSCPQPDEDASGQGVGVNRFELTLIDHFGGAYLNRLFQDEAEMVRVGASSSSNAPSLGSAK